MHLEAYYERSADTVFTFKQVDADVLHCRRGGGEALGVWEGEDDKDKTEEE